VPFTVTIPRTRQDKTIVDRLRAELSGILSWSLEGCRRWQRSGLSEPDAVRVATSDYQTDMDVVGGFLTECCVVADTTWISAAALYAEYQSWATDNGERAVSQRALGLALTERGFARRQRGAQRRWHWFGVGLVNPRTDENPESGFNAHARTRVGRTGKQGSDGFKRSPMARLPYAEGG
jgi:putative DNA primase/helicase